MNINWYSTAKQFFLYSRNHPSPSYCAVLRSGYIFLSIAYVFRGADFFITKVNWNNYPMLFRQNKLIKTSKTVTLIAGAADPFL